MKRTLILATILALSLPALAMAGAGRPCANPGGLAQVLAELPSEELSEVESADLLFMREEEKLARDVYITLNDKWGMRVFENISQAEQKHMDAVLVLIDKYGLVDPVGENPRGAFVNEELQTLHDTLVARGSESLVAALEVGALIEETDIVDLNDAIARDDNQDVLTLWQNLNKGSRNHMRAFYGLLLDNGVTYEPTELDSVALQEIVDSARERGMVDAEGESISGPGGRAAGRGRGRGHGYRGGRLR
jgi:hypothetical protein